MLLWGGLVSLKQWERERQWHPRMELEVEPGRAWENSQLPPTRRRSACWSRGLSRSPSFHVISRHLNKVLLALQSIETERMVHWEFYLVSLPCVWWTHSSHYPHFNFLAFLDCCFLHDKKRVWDALLISLLSFFQNWNIIVAFSDLPPNIIHQFLSHSSVGFTKTCNFSPFTCFFLFFSSLVAYAIIFF